MGGKTDLGLAMTTINLSMLPGGLMKDLQFQNASILPDTRTDTLSTPFSILPEGEVVMKLSPQGGSLQGFLGACSPPPVQLSTNLSCSC
jgi:hypothetical protein